MATKTIKEEITIKFAGDSGDGMQMTGNVFTANTAITGTHRLLFSFNFIQFMK